MIIFGTGGHAKVVYDCLLANNIKLEYFIDTQNLDKNIFMGKGCVHEYFSLDNPSQELIIAIGNNQNRKRVSKEISHKFAKVIHPSAQVSLFSEIEEGTAIMHSAILQAGTKVGKHCIVNTSASIDHDCIISDFAQISPGAILCGEVSIGDESLVGAGAVIRQGVKIGKGVLVGAGAVIIDDVPDGVLIVGSPGRIVKKIDSTYV